MCLCCVCRYYKHLLHHVSTIEHQGVAKLLLLLLPFIIVIYHCYIIIVIVYYHCLLIHLYQILFVISPVHK